MRPIFIAAVVAAALASPAQAQLTVDICQADYNTMIAAAERNRTKSVAEIEYVLKRSTDDTQAANLMEQLDRAWEDEENHRSLAAVALRDCLKYVKAKAQ